MSGIRKPVCMDHCSAIQPMNIGMIASPPIAVTIQADPPQLPTSIR